MRDRLTNGFLLTQSQEKINPEQALAMLTQTYWGLDRGLPQMKRIMEHSLNCGLLDGEGRLVGYMRAVTDYETVFYLADVVIMEGLRGQGLGKAMLAYFLEDPRLQGLRGILRTKDAHGFYEPFGFIRQGERLMFREMTGA